MPMFEHPYVEKKQRQDNEILTQRMQHHRQALTTALRSLPADEICDLVSAGLASRSDIEVTDLKKLASEVTTMYWPRM